MQDRNGQASDEGTDAIVAKARVVARRRVRFALAAPIVLLCGGVGVAAGWVFPPQALMTGGDRADERTHGKAALTATAKVTSSTPSTVPVEPSPPTDQSINLPAPETTPMTKGAALEQPQSKQPPAAAPASERRGSIEAEAPGGIKHETEASGAVRKKQPRTAERRERHVTKEAAKPKRASTSDPSQERATQKRSPTIISQIPVLGPVFGLLLP